MAPKVRTREKRRDRHAMEPLHRNGISSTPGGTRIPNLLIRSQTLYPIELRALASDKVIRRAPYTQGKERHL